MSNVYTLPPRADNRPRPFPFNAFDDLTDRIVLAQAEAGTLDPAIVAALLAAVRQPAGECGR